MTITHNSIEIEILEAYQTPQVRCLPGDIFIQPDEEGQFWIYTWDGDEAWTIGEHGIDSLSDAIEAAKVSAEQVVHE